MKRYLQAMLLFDLLLPALFLLIPGFVLFWAFSGFQDYVQARTAELIEHKDRARMVEVLTRQLKPLEPKVPALHELLSSNDIEARIGHTIGASLDKFSSDEIERTLNDLQYGTSSIGQNIGEGPRLSLKFSSRWEALNAAALNWEIQCPNLLLESLSLERVAAQPLSAPHLEATMSYFVITEN